MAVTITPLQLAYELRLGDGVTPLVEPLASTVGQRLGAASAMVLEYTPDAPDYAVNEAVIRASAYLQDNDGARNRRFTDVLAFSGALSILSSFRVHRALSLEDVAAAISNGTGLDVDAVLALISGWAHVGNTDQIPADKLGNAGGMGASPLLVATVDVTNAQIKNLDTAYVELIPAVASNEYIKVDQIWFHKFGTDAPTIVSSAPKPNAESLDHYTNYILAMMVTNTAAALPLGADHGDYIWVVGGDLQDGGDLLRSEPYVDGSGVGGHAFAEGTPLVLGLVARPANYSEAAWDEFIATVNDVSLRITIFYSVHSRPVV